MCFLRLLVRVADVRIYLGLGSTSPLPLPLKYSPPALRATAEQSLLASVVGEDANSLETTSTGTVITPYCVDIVQHCVTPYCVDIVHLWKTS